MRPYRSYIILIVLFLTAGLYFTCYFTIAVENRSGAVIERLELQNRFCEKTWTMVPPDTVITVKAFIPFDRKVSVRAESGETIRHFMFTAENAYAGTKYNTLLIDSGITRENP